MTHPAQRHLEDPAGGSLPSTFKEAALFMGHPPDDLRPSQYTKGLWIRRDSRGTVRHFWFHDSLDPSSPGYRPGGKYRTWKEHSSRVRVERRKRRGWQL